MVAVAQLRCAASSSAHENCRTRSFGWHPTFTHPASRLQVAVNVGGEQKNFSIEVHAEWAPLGAARFEELASTPGFFTGVRFFRTIKGVSKEGVPAHLAPSQAAPPFMCFLRGVLHR